MARERWLVDGWELTEGAVRDVEVRAGLYGTPQLVGADSSVSSRAGDLWRRKQLGPGAFTLRLWLGEGSRALLEPAYDELLRRTVAVQHRLQTWTRHLADGTVRECRAYVADRVEPDSEQLGQVGMRLQLAAVVPSGSWRDTADSTLLAGPAFAPGTSHVLDAARATAPLDELLLVVTGPGTDLRLTDPATGEYVQLDGALAAGQEWQVHAGTWQSRTAPSGTLRDPAVTAGTTNKVATTRYTGGRLLTVVPDQLAGGARVLTGGTNTTGATTLTVLGRRKYLA